MLRHISTYLDLSAIFRAANMQHGEHTEFSVTQPEADEAIYAIQGSSKKAAKEVT